MIVNLIRKYLRGRYYEPFLGGGAVFFELLPERATLSDINEDLIGTYIAIRDHYLGVTNRLRNLRVSSAAYYRLRAQRPTDELDRAARFLYLNRTAFAGMYRLNAKGEFNVPFGGGGRTPSLLWEDELLKSAAGALSSASIRHADFEVCMNRAREGDVIYCDPTYTVAHDQNGFVRYNDKNFSWGDQERLALASKRAVERGATVIISNAHHKLVRDLYAGARSYVLSRITCVSTDPTKRRPVSEYLFVLSQH